MRLYFRFYVILAFAFLLQSCVSTQAYWKKKVYQPKKEAVLYYSPNPSLFNSSAVSRREQDAKMKMIHFCHPQEPVVFSERQAEEVIGTQYHSYQSDHGQPVYYEEAEKKVVRKNKSSKTVSGFISSPSSSSSGGGASQNIVRNRVYITFGCK